MSKKLLLVDYENVNKIDLSRLDESYSAIFSWVRSRIRLRPSASTIGFEKRFNPMLAMSREAFVDVVTADIPPQPQDMARIIDTNLRDTVTKVTRV